MLDGLTAGLRWSGGGLFFSVLVLESLRRILKIRLAPRFLAAAYFMLALFFLYPVLNARLIAIYPDDRLPGVLAILFFPVAAAAALLGFLPYLHQKNIPESGTPWKTPYFPWSIAALLGAGALFRTYLLTISFDPARGTGGFNALESGFMLWMWVPVLLAGMILAMEYAMLHRRNTLSRLCLPLLFFMTMITPEQLNARRLISATQSRSSPGASACLPRLRSISMHGAGKSPAENTARCSYWQSSHSQNIRQVPAGPEERLF